MGRDRAAYMREYRAKRRGQTTITGDLSDPFGQFLLTTKVEQLEEEVRHLKAELAKRPPERVLSSNPILAAMGLDEEGNPPGIRFNSRPFTPVPKKR